MSTAPSPHPRFFPFPSGGSGIFSRCAGPEAPAPGCLEKQVDALKAQVADSEERGRGQTFVIEAIASFSTIFFPLSLF